MILRLQELAARLGCTLQGDGACEVERVAALQDAGRGELAFVGNPKYRKYLKDTQAAAVIIEPALLPDCRVNALVCDNPHLAFARAAELLHPAKPMVPGCHPTAVIAEDAHVHCEAYVGAHAVVESGAVIAAGVFVGPGSLVGEGARVGRDSRLVANVTLCHGVQVGERAVIHPGAVIGSDGFGLANDRGAWVKVPQLGGVVIGDDVEVGANTTIDRGALKDTIIGQGVKLDNQIQIAHNCEIGDHSALAGCVGIAGSTKVGRYCTLGGGVGLAGHLEFGDHCHFTGQSLVTRSFKGPGVYSGNLPAMPAMEWRKTVARLRRLEELEQRVRALEKLLNARNQET